MNPKVSQKFANYPKHVVPALLKVRAQILLTAHEYELAVEETLKWGEPSYICNGGSTVRFDWKSKFPEQYAIYFNCQTTLVESFKEIYPDAFKFEGNRAMVFGLEDEVDWAAFRHCISLALRYHKIKHLPLLGA